MAKRKTPKTVKAKTSRARSHPKKRAASRAKPARARVAKKVTGKKVAKKVAKTVAKSVAKKATKKKAAKTVAKKLAAGAKKPERAPTKVGAGPGLRRRDGSGHMDPKYAADLRRQSGPSEAAGVGFLDQSRSSDDLAESLGEQFVEAATTGEDAAEKALDQEVPEERGGPFVRSNAGIEFAEGTDKSNPRGAKREPFPTT